MGQPGRRLDVNARATFISRTYAHLCGAVFGFTLIEIFLPVSLAEYRPGHDERLVADRSGRLCAGFLAGQRTAHAAVSKPAQYGALAAFVAAEAIIFVPLLYLAQSVAPGSSERGFGDLPRIRSAHGHRLRDSKGFLIPKRPSVLGGESGPGRDRGCRVVRLQLGHLVFDRDGGPGGWSHPIQHLQRAASLFRRPLRGGGAGTVCVHGADVLVCAAAISVPTIGLNLVRRHHLGVFLLRLFQFPICSRAAIHLMGRAVSRLNRAARTSFAGSLLSRPPKQTSFQPKRSSSSPIQENVLSPVASTHHVVNGPGRLDMNLARHDSTGAKL